jgi:hypothetical protein
MKITKLFGSLFFIAAIVGCREDEPGYLQGDIFGRVGFLEANYFNWVDTLAGVEVILEAEDGSTQTTVTGSGGTFVFRNVTAGTYGISFNKENFRHINFSDFSMVTKTSLLHLGGGATIVDEVFLLEIPLFPTTLTNYSWDGNTLVLDLTINDVDADRYFFTLFFGNESTVSSASSVKYDTYYADNIQLTRNGSGGTDIQLRYSLGVFSYQYVIAYPTSLWSPAVLGNASNVLHIPK